MPLIPLILRYPVDDPVIVQPFGVNWTGVKTFYSRFGLPAHEGVDFRALVGTPIHACAEGVVSRVEAAEFVGSGSAYGVQVRILHPRSDGVFESIYAHFERIAEGIIVDAAVQAGQIIGYADHTGNARGDHLHLSLKKKGATARGERQTLGSGYRVVYPSDLVDPTPYFQQEK